jgi:hypothetical protein
VYTVMFQFLLIPNQILIRKATTTTKKKKKNDFIKLYNSNNFFQDQPLDI